MNFLRDLTASGSSFFKKRQLTKSEVNILLLGESGVGKSTFINSFANYTTYNTLAEAEKNKTICLVPSSFSIVDKYLKDQVVKLEYDKNGDQEVGNSSTRGAQTYTFNHKKGFKIRLIDAPGIRDYSDLDQDRANFRQVLSYLSRFAYLNAICIFINPNKSRENNYSELSLIYLFSCIENSAKSNVCFILTNARSSFFKPDYTLPVLRKLLLDIKDCPMCKNIPCSKKNMFCFDNEGFKYLAASNQGVQFSSSDKEIFSNSYNESEDSCRKLIKYICGDSGRDGLKPYIIKREVWG